MYRRTEVESMVIQGISGSKYNFNKNIQKEVGIKPTHYHA